MYLIRACRELAEEADATTCTINDYTVWLMGLPEDASAEEVEELMAQHGEVASVHLVRCGHRRGVGICNQPQRQLAIVENASSSLAVFRDMRCCCIPLSGHRICTSTILLLHVLFPCSCEPRSLSGRRCVRTASFCR